MNEPANMWSYWRDKKGTENALRDYYPDTLADSLSLQIKLMEIRDAKVTIDKIFLRREAKEDSYDYI